MTPTDTSALLAKREAMARQKPYSPEWCSARVAYQDALVSAAPALLDELDRLRGQVARVEALRAYGWANGQQVATPQIRNALAIPAEGGECDTCGEGGFPQNECPESKRPCGHHCNHVWTHDQCDWCGKHFDAEGGE